MMKVRISAAALALGLVVAMASSASAAQARPHRAGAPGHAANAQAIGGDAGMTAHRDAALRACTAQANRFGEATYGGDTPSQVYRACMMQHGESE